MMATQVQKTPLPDEMLAEIWTMMHLTAQSARPHHLLRHHHQDEDDQDVFSAECGEEETDNDDQLETDYHLDANANENDADIQAMKKAGDTLAVIGDSFDLVSKEDQNALIDDIVNCLNARAKNIDKQLELDLNSPKPVDVFKDALVSAAYSEVSPKIEKFLVGEEGLSKIAFVTSITKGVSSALASESRAAVGLAAALSYRFISEKFANILMESGGLRNLVASKK